MHIQATTLKSRSRAGLTLVEVMVTATLFAIVGTVATLLFNNLQGTTNRSSSEMDATKRIRWVVERAIPMLASIYIPPIPGANGGLEKPIAPLASNPPTPGFTASNTITQIYNPAGPGNDSILFYSCADLANSDRILQVPTEPTPVPFVAATYSPPRLYELRLDPVAKTDRSGQGLTLRDLVLREYNLSNPLSFGVGPGTLKTATTPRIISRGISNFRLTQPSAASLRMVVSVQYTPSTLRYRNRVDPSKIKTYSITTDILLPNLCLR